MAYEFSISDATVSSIITILIATFLINFAAKLVIDRGGIIASLLTAILGSLLGSIVAGLITGIWGLVAGIAVWALVAAIFFRTAWIKGAIIGLVAGVLWLLINLAIDALL